MKGTEFLYLGTCTIHVGGILFSMSATCTKHTNLTYLKAEMTAMFFKVFGFIWFKSYAINTGWKIAFIFKYKFYIAD
jgi:hypothetical protein